MNKPCIAHHHVALALLRATIVRTHQMDDALIRQRVDVFRSYQALTPPRVLTSDGEVIAGAYRRDDLPARATTQASNEVRFESPRDAIDSSTAPKTPPERRGGGGNPSHPTNWLGFVFASPEGNPSPGRNATRTRHNSQCPPVRASWR
ncbi:hypothetical protein [Myxococcus sp. SDU36]|uniref:hypothetical protein n=1 Tax=Myxococcus sp. SDU36 TaxID=2831967 RepID=UPI00254361C6|nr:hypothetical protein [Myxococcus sp. SDU36]WIG99528.1 hypothetical protein KGD87_35155 [Myxococcus sp. SDU36]